MPYQALLLLPIALIFYGWHRSLPATLTAELFSPEPQPHKHKNHHKRNMLAGSTVVAGGIMASRNHNFVDDDLPWMSDDDSSCFDSQGAIIPTGISSGIGIMDDMYDPACSYLAYNIYHHDDIFDHMNDISNTNNISGIDDGIGFNSNDDFGIGGIGNINNDD